MNDKLTFRDWLNIAGYFVGFAVLAVWAYVIVFFIGGLGK